MLPNVHERQISISTVVNTRYLARFSPTTITNSSLTEEDWVRLKIADINVDLKSWKRKKQLWMFERQPKLFGSSFCPSLQLVGRVAGLLVKVNKNREPHPHRTCNAAQKKSTNWSIKCLLESITPNICAHCPIDATLMLAHYSECSQHQEKIILRIPLS